MLFKKTALPFLFLGLLFVIPRISFAQTLFVNEISNGPGGSKEFIELVVDAGACGTMDLRGYIIDDNNGANDASCQGFSSTTASGQGIARGHYMFDSIPFWQNIPNGSIILIYNSSDRNPKIPPDDEDDLSPHDSIYIIPITSSKIKRCTSIPYGPGGNCDYKPGTYSTPTTWTSIGMRNSGDAGQVRYPDGSYCHGISYGSSMNGGPDNLRISSSSGTGKCFYFNDGDYRNASNFSVGTAGSANETPGDYNNAANRAYIRNFRTCTFLDLVQDPVAHCENGSLTVRFQPLSEVESIVLEYLDQFGSIIEADRMDFPAVNEMTELQIREAPVFSYWRLREEYSDGSKKSHPWMENPCNGLLQPLRYYQEGANIRLIGCRPDIHYFLFDSEGRMLREAKADQSGTVRFEFNTAHTHFLMAASEDKKESVGIIVTR